MPPTRSEPAATSEDTAIIKGRELDKVHRVSLDSYAGHMSLLEAHAATAGRLLNCHAPVAEYPCLRKGLQRAK